MHPPPAPARSRSLQERLEVPGDDGPTKAADRTSSTPIVSTACTRTVAPSKTSGRNEKCRVALRQIKANHVPSKYNSVATGVEPTVVTVATAGCKA